MGHVREREREGESEGGSEREREREGEMSKYGACKREGKRKTWIVIGV